ncbi:DegT/DnrJ/EryC1/StrS family aminotransferase [Herbidospora mongoliensis]|uniref:DegT/DnrJ/EryC1/StrS family aminotransferase n=1 Tax=Herbidospora mongoliensis TaxID=688067 RepID=UPI000A026FCE|nr:DegT/DnrJ/EryC1/StrS family aminotransferase [Herbidospora mongoliensis]
MTVVGTVTRIRAEGHARRVVGMRQVILEIVDDVAASGAFHYGPRTAAMEKAFERSWGGHAVATTSCTQALQLALRAAGIGAGDEVVVPAATFAATAFAVAAVGAVPVIVDVEPDTRCISVAAVETALTPRTRAVIPVHLHGHMADMPALCALAARHGLTVIEDCAQAAGATLHGRPAGTFGDFGCFSLWVGKVIGGLDDGGLILTNRPDAVPLLRRLTNMGRTTADRHTHHEAGARARLGEANAAIITHQLGLLPGWAARRRELAAFFDESFADLPVRTPSVAPGHEHVYYKYVLQVPDVPALAEHLDRRGIESEQVYPYLLPDQPAFADFVHRAHPTPQAAAVNPHLICLPLYPELTDEEAGRIAAAVRDFHMCDGPIVVPFRQV